MDGDLRRFDEPSVMLLRFTFFPCPARMLLNFEQVAASFSSAFGIFTGGEMAFGKGSLLGDGATQLNELDSYINSMGMNQQGAEDVRFAQDRCAERGGEGTDGGQRTTGGEG